MDGDFCDVISIDRALRNECDLLLFLFIYLFINIFIYYYFLFGGREGEGFFSK